MQHQLYYFQWHILYLLPPPSLNLFYLPHSLSCCMAVIVPIVLFLPHTVHTGSLQAPNAQIHQRYHPPLMFSLLKHCSNITAFILHFSLQYLTVRMQNEMSYPTQYNGTLSKEIYFCSSSSTLFRQKIIDLNFKRKQMLYAMLNTMPLHSQIDSFISFAYLYCCSHFQWLSPSLLFCIQLFQIFWNHFYLDFVILF